MATGLKSLCPTSLGKLGAWLCGSTTAPVAHCHCKCLQRPCAPWPVGLLSPPQFQLLSGLGYLQSNDDSQGTAGLQSQDASGWAFSPAPGSPPAVSPVSGALGTLAASCGYLAFASPGVVLDLLVEEKVYEGGQRAPERLQVLKAKEKILTSSIYKNPATHFLSKHDDFEGLSLFF